MRSAENKGEKGESAIWHIEKYLWATYVIMYRFFPFFGAYFHIWFGRLSIRLWLYINRTDKKSNCMRETTSFPWKWKYILVLDSAGNDASGALGKERESVPDYCVRFRILFSAFAAPGSPSRSGMENGERKRALAHTNICTKTNEIVKHIADTSTHSNAGANSMLLCKVFN